VVWSHTHDDDDDDDHNNNSNKPKLCSVLLTVTAGLCGTPFPSLAQLLVDELKVELEKRHTVYISKHLKYMGFSFLSLFLFSS